MLSKNSRSELQEGEILRDEVAKAISRVSRGQELDSHPLRDVLVDLAERHAQRQGRIMILVCARTIIIPSLTKAEQVFLC